jgi:hypothetical protein
VPKHFQAATAARNTRRKWERLAVLGTLTRQMMIGLNTVNRPMTSRTGSRSTAQGQRHLLGTVGSSPKWVTRIKMGTADATSSEGQVA